MIIFIKRLHGEGNTDRKNKTAIKDQDIAITPSRDESLLGKSALRKSSRESCPTTPLE
jgi:hypothetical protein